jgi:hypothetical protein
VGAGDTYIHPTGAPAPGPPVGPAGRFEVERIDLGTYTALVTAPGYRPTATTLALNGPGATSDFTLVGTTALAGVVRQAASGAALAGASVTLTDATGQVVAQAVTGPDGTYRFEDVAEGGYTVVGSGFPPVARSLDLSSTEDHSLDLDLGQVRG